ncbi:PREDICTED: DNA cross-link repair 1A protein [Tinamus guttatus]|uniref:DNA cross-link repair 1A protein n=1 Tax=Tinamus guttatus TaxID=94827 RepID=UPI00052EA23B|nr:PREDICTED: DNA cross-link repair 1A protein [Tinamus guttatus]
MSEDALLEEEIWEYKSIRKQKLEPQGGSESGSAPVRTISNGKCRPKRKGNGNKKKSVEKTDTIRKSTDTIKKSKRRSRPDPDLDQSKDDPVVQSQESVSNLTEQSSHSAKPVHDGHCPSCQMPFSLLVVQTPRWHVAECLDTPGPVEKECPDGLLCTSTIPSHYKRFTHFLLAASRAGDYLIHSSTCTPERKGTCSTAAEPSCLPTLVETTSQNEKPSRNGPNAEQTLVVQSSAQMKSLNITSESTSSSANVERPQQTLQFTQSTDDNCQFEFYDFASSQGSEIGEDLDSQRDTNQPSLLQSKVDFSDCEISYSPLSTCEESEEETEKEEKKIKAFQNKLLEVQNSENEYSNSVLFKNFEGLPIQHVKMGSNKTEHCEKINTSSHLDPSVKTVSQSHMNSKFSNSACVANQHQQEVLNTASSFPLQYNRTQEEGEESELLAPVANAGNKDSEDRGAYAVDSAYVALSDMVLLQVSEGARSVLPQESNILKDPSNLLTSVDKMTASMTEKAGCQESLQSVTEKEGNLPNKTPVCCSSPVSKTVQAVSLASMNAKSSSAKELKQMDIGVFFGLKPKAKEESKKEEESKRATVSSEGMQILNPVTPNGKTPRRRKRKAEGSVEDVEAVIGSPNKNGGFADANSGGQRRWRKRFRESSTTGEGTRKKQCPFYKKIPGTGFTVDAFQYGEIEGCTAYFLTHFHSDHYCGLTKNFMFPIYCNKITGNLVKSKLRVKEQYIHVLPMDTECVVNGIKVLLLDANHCPGATMILFCLPTGNVILHTGDFRADPSMERYSPLIGRKVHTLYLDTTYCSPEYTFPSQQEVIQFAVNTAFETVTLNPRTLVVCGTYSIGKEKVFLAIAEVLGSKASMSHDKYKTLQCLESAAVNSLISMDWHDSLLHVLPMMQINFKGLQDHLNKFAENFDQVLAFRPTGWTYSDSCYSVVDIKPQTRGRITIYGIPYSEHSSYLEMKRFVQWLKPQKIIPTVNAGDWRARSLMEKQFRDWMVESNGHK